LFVIIGCGHAGCCQTKGDEDKEMFNKAKAADQQLLMMR